MTACAGKPPEWFDATIEGESEEQRRHRQALALAVCRDCPVRVRCADTIDLRHDDGIRGGIVLPTIHDKHRRGLGSYVPGRSGLGALIA